MRARSKRALAASGLRSGGLRTVLLAAGVFACSTDPMSIPRMESPISPEPPAAAQESVASGIEDSIPEVSYSTYTPGGHDTSAGAVLNPRGSMGPEEAEQLLRRLESLDGEDKIVCLPTRDRAFGECEFPLPDEPVD